MQKAVSNMTETEETDDVFRELAKEMKESIEQ
jgi:hypothetical protein